MLKRIYAFILSMAVLAAAFAGITPVYAAASAINYVSIDRSHGLNVGDVLEAVPNFNGTADESEAVTYQWKRLKRESKLVGKHSMEGLSYGVLPYSNIEGATQKAYTITEEDEGYILKVEATYNGKTVFSGDAVAVGNILSSYSIPAPASYSLIKYENATTSADEYKIGNVARDVTSVDGYLINNSNNADRYMNYSNGGSGEKSYFVFPVKEIAVAEYSFAVPVELEEVFVEAGYPDSANPIQNAFVQVMYENETEYKDWSKCTEWGRTQAEANASKYQRYFFLNMLPDPTLVGADAGKRVSKLKVIIAPKYDAAKEGNVYVREVCAFAKQMPAITAIDGLDGAYVKGTGVFDVSEETTASVLKSAISTNACTAMVNILEEDLNTAVKDDAFVNDTMIIELVSASGESVYYTITLKKPPEPVIDWISLSNVELKNDTREILYIKDGTRAGELLDAIKALYTSSVKVVAYDKATEVERDMYIDESMLVELTDNKGENKYYYSITMADASIDGLELQNIALAGSIVANGAYTSSPIKNAIDNNNATQFTSAGNKDASNTNAQYRPFGENPIIDLTLDGEAIISKIEILTHLKENNFTIEVSADGKNWKNLGQTTFKEVIYLENTGTLDADVKVHDIEFSPVVARFIRATYSAYVNVSVRHFKVWGAYTVPPIATDNLAYNKTGTSSAGNAATKIENMFDLKKDTRWRSVNGETENPWVCLDFGEAKNVGSLSVYDDNEDVNYDISVSLDGVNWENPGKTTNAGEVSSPYLKTFDGFFEARYIKLVSDKAENITIFEFEAYAGKEPEEENADIAKNKSITVNADAIALENDITKAVDGDDETVFLTQIASPYDIILDLEEIAGISEIIIKEAKSNYNIKSFTVSISEDKAEWDNIHKGSSIGSNLKLELDAKKARYIKISVTGVSAVPSGIGEIEVYRGEGGSSEIDAAVSNTELPEIINKDYSLPVKYNDTVSIEWKSSNEDIIKVEDGKTVINLPKKNTGVTLTAVFSLNGETKTVTYSCTVKGKGTTSTSGSSAGGGGSSSGESSSGGLGGGVFTAAAPADSYIGEVKNTDENTSLYKELDGHWGADKIKSLVEKGIIKGDNGSLQLKRTVTRAEFGAMLARGLELDKTEYKGEFEDIKATDWFAKEIGTLIDNNIMVGADGKFRPNDAITRQEMAVVASNVAKIILKSESSSDYELAFADNEKISAWAVDAVKLAAQNEFISGFDDGEFKPLELLTREQAMVVIYKLING